MNSTLKIGLKGGIICAMLQALLAKVAMLEGESLAAN